MQVLIGFFLAALIALLAWRARALSTSGAFAALLTGGLIFGLGGLSWATLLLVFFVSSSALSRLFAPRKAALSEKFSKGSRRDWAQVLANGGLGALLVVGFALLDEPVWIWAAYIGAMAAVNADTWATEIGVLNPSLPRLVTTWKPVERGTSGAVSRLGTLAALGGSALVGLAAVLVSSQLPLGVALLAACLGGLAGSFFDSFLGATVQSIYYCPSCQKETERHPRHVCGSPTRHLRGWRWLDNDGVNFLCSLVGAIVAVLVWGL
ncbi:MAG: putative rane protein [Chloroflexi bacterium]|nr:putative rane protein [Chloroflexota bacterium]